MNNPLLNDHELPVFSQILTEHIEPAIDQLLAEARSLRERLLEVNNNYTWDNLIAPMEAMEDRIEKAWSPVSHMNSVVNNEALRNAYNACLPKMTEFSSEMGQHEGLFKAYCSMAESPTYQRLSNAQKKTIENTLRSFRLSGIDLKPDKQQRYKDINKQLSKLSSQFEENLLDATHHWTKLITDPKDLTGLPETAMTLARQTAQQRQQDGWLITLEIPSYLAIMTYADNRHLRQEVYTAFATRASDQSPDSTEWDNTRIMDEILALRHEKAQLLDFANYAEYSLATKMADTPEQVIAFLEDLAKKSKTQAQKDLDEMTDFARQHFQIEQLESWDLNYCSEKMLQQQFQLSQEAVKAYFPIDKVLPGLFAIVEKLYGLQISEINDFDRWHDDVRLFQIIDRDGQLRGKFYIDLYARPNKRGGAWMDDCVGRRKTETGQIQNPVAYLTCNFTPPIGDDPALLTHDEVITLFHEFGHGLHHMLTQIDYLSVSGINGVQWDAVELPSQFMENWCWEQPALALISGHYQTGEALPDELFKKMLAAKNFQSAMAMVRQLEFSLFDFRIHQQYDPQQGSRIAEFLAEIRAQVAVVQPPPFNRFAHSFAHIFAGGYAAGYYSYKWAEVLSSDAFALFEENGIFDADTGRAFLNHILEQGGSADAMELFTRFRGRKPEIDALLRHNGIAA